jgi:hypothetical protein
VQVRADENRKPKKESFDVPEVSIAGTMYFSLKYLQQIKELYYGIQRPPSHLTTLSQIVAHRSKCKCGPAKTLFALSPLKPGGLFKVQHTELVVKV